MASGRDGADPRRGNRRQHVVAEMFDDASDIAAFLVEEEGMNRALEAAADGIARAHAERDYYLLSVWREVRIILRNRRETVGEERGAAEG